MKSELKKIKILTLYRTGQPQDLDFMNALYLHIIGGTTMKNNFKERSQSMVAEQVVLDGFKLKVRIKSFRKNNLNYNIWMSLFLHKLS